MKFYGYTIDEAKGHDHSLMATEYVIAAMKFRALDEACCFSYDNELYRRARRTAEYERDEAFTKLTEEIFDGIVEKDDIDIWGVYDLMYDLDYICEAFGA